MIITILFQDWNALSIGWTFHRTEVYLLLHLQNQKDLSSNGSDQSAAG